MNTYFVKEDSIVRKIWGKADTVLFIFAGAAAEFALSRAVDWLYFTGKLPADPLGRLFTTVNYAKVIVFAEDKVAKNAIETMNNVHGKVEEKRGSRIPSWAYRDVLFMLIDYSIRAYENLERNLSKAEKQEVVSVFTRVGCLMNIPDLPETLEEWEKQRKLQLNKNFTYSNYTKDLFLQYRKHLGFFRYKLLLEAQILMAPKTIRKKLNFRDFSMLKLIISGYKLSRRFKFDKFIKELMLPNAYKEEINALDR